MSRKHGQATRGEYKSIVCILGYKIRKFDAQLEPNSKLGNGKKSNKEGFPQVH